ATRRAASRMNKSTLRALRNEWMAMADAASDDDEPTLMDHDRKFHRVILEQSGNRRLAEFVDQLRDLVLIRGISTVARSRSLADIVNEHRLVLEALESSNADLSADLMRSHILHTGELLLHQSGSHDTAAAIAWETTVRAQT